jgi:predicted MFS family arabinose efflux permease
MDSLQTMRLVMGSPQLRRIVLAYTVNRLGGWFGLLALVLAVYDHTHSALAVSALMFASLALPALVVPAVVAKVEASRRRRELSALYVFEAILTAGLAVLLWNFSLAAILVVVTLDGIAALAASALLRSEVARAARGWIESEATAGVPSDELDAAAEDAERHANAALNLGFSMSFILGPAIAGAVVAAAGAPTALLIDVGSFLACGMLLLDLHPHVEEAGGDSVRTRLRAARDHIAGAPTLKRLFIAELVALTFIETGAPIEVEYVKSTLGAGDRGVGVLLAMWGAGGIVGSIVFARLVKWPLRILLGAGTLCIATAYLGLAVAPSLALACVAGLVGGVGNGMQWPSLISAVQKLTPDSLQGRMMGAAESLGALCVAIGLPLGGALAEILSPRTAFWVVGAGAALATGALLRVQIAGSADADTPTSAPPQAGPEGLGHGSPDLLKPEHISN